MLAALCAAQRLVCGLEQVIARLAADTGALRRERR